MSSQNPSCRTEFGGDGETRHPFASSNVQQELTALADVLGRKWNLVILDRLLANGPMGFSDLLEDIEDISSKVLSDSLTALEAADFVDRTIVNERPFRVEYAVTRRGKRLESLIAKVRDGDLRVS